MIISDDVLSQELNIVSFSESVEEHYRSGKFETYLAAIMDMAEEMDLEDKDVSKLLTGALRDKLEQEAIEEGLLKRTSTPMMKFV